MPVERPTALRTGPWVVFAIFLTLVSVGCGASGPARGGADPAPGGMDTSSSTDTVPESSLDVRLEDVGELRPTESGEGRNPFRFGPAGGAPRPGSVTDVQLDPSLPGLTPPPVAISPAPRGGSDAVPAALRFIGFVDAQLSAGLVAVLTDGVRVFHGRANDVIDGRYRVVEIGVETVEIEHLPGGGRQVLRLSGS